MENFSEKTGIFQYVMYQGLEFEFSVCVCLKRFDVRFRRTKIRFGKFEVRSGSINTNGGYGIAWSKRLPKLSSLSACAFPLKVKESGLHEGLFE